MHKTATQSHNYVGTGSDASNAVDGNIATCMKSNGIGTNDPDKTVWWKVDLGRLYSFNSINIQFKNYDGYGVHYYYTTMQLSDNFHIYFAAV